MLFKIVLTAYAAFSLGATMASIGHPREPVTMTETMVVIAIWGTLLWLMWRYV